MVIHEKYYQFFIYGISSNYKLFDLLNVPLKKIKKLDF